MWVVLTLDRLKARVWSIGKVGMGGPIPIESGDTGGLLDGIQVNGWLVFRSGVGAPGKLLEDALQVGPFFGWGLT